MGIFSRVKDIVTANINALLDAAENPEQTLKLMIKEMEDTLVDEKARAAQLLADQKKVEGNLNVARQLIEDWQQKAELAISKNRDDLARKALEEKKSFLTQIPTLEERKATLLAAVEKCGHDIANLEGRLSDSKVRYEILSAKAASQGLRRKMRSEGTAPVKSDAVSKFDQIEARMKKLESELDQGTPADRASVEEAFEKLEQQDDIEKELKALKKKQK